MEFKVKGSQACINYPKRGVNLMNLKWDDTLSNCFVSSNGKDVSISEPRGFA